MKTVKVLSLLALISTLASAGVAQAWDSSTTWGNGKTTSSSRTWTNNGDGTYTRNSRFTGPNGNTVTRSATHGNGSVTVTYGNGRTRTTTHNR